MKWDKSVEDIMEELCDEAQVRNKLHRRCYEHFNKTNNWYQLPIIVISVLSGSGNFIAGQFPSIEQYMILVIGGFSMFNSIITSIAQYKKIAQLGEGHRIAYLQWGKFYSSLKFQLLQRKKNREPCGDFLRTTLDTYDRLFEISPNVPQSFITQLHRELGRTHIDPNFKKPYYLNGWSHIQAVTTPDTVSIEVAEEEEQPPSITSSQDNISL